MKTKKLLIALSLLLVFISTTGQDCDSFDPMALLGENADYRAIKDLMNRFKDGINLMDESILKDVISDQFLAGSKDQLSMIMNYFDQELTINKIGVSSLNVDGRGAEGKVNWTGTLTLRPKPDIPFVADKIPALSGDVEAGLIFGFVKEDDGNWRIKAQKVLKIVKSAVWGSGPPQISNFDMNKSEVLPGATVNVDADLKRESGNVMLAAVNDVAIVNAITGISNGPIDTVKLKVPSGLKPGDSYDVNIIALGINANFINPAASSITGITFKQVSIPVVE